MRQLFRYLPPNIVSWKCVCHESCASTFANAAAMPPSAITVCALPSNDLQTKAVRAPDADASMAARNPAPPAPITMMSCSCVSYFSSKAISENPHVAPDSHRTKPDVKIGEADSEQADPRPFHVSEIQNRDTAPKLETRSRRRRAGETIEFTADEMTQRIAAETEAGQCHDVDQQNE